MSGTGSWSSSHHELALDALDARDPIDETDRMEVRFVELELIEEHVEVRLDGLELPCELCDIRFVRRGLRAGLEDRVGLDCRLDCGLEGPRSGLDCRLDCGLESRELSELSVARVVFDELDTVDTRGELGVRCC